MRAFCGTWDMLQIEYQVFFPAAGIKMLACQYRVENMFCTIRESHDHFIIPEEQSGTGTAIGRGIKIGIGMPFSVYQVE